MNDFLKMDIFFMITTLVVIILGIAVTFILFRIWRILGNVEKISAMLSDEGSLVRKDIADFRSNVRREGFRMRFISNFFRDIGKRFSGGTTKK